MSYRKFLDIFGRKTTSIFILIIKATEMHYFTTLFAKELYMYRTNLLSIIRSVNTVFAAVSSILISLADSQHN